jgi:hypothetical protein
MKRYGATHLAELIRNGDLPADFFGECGQITTYKCLFDSLLTPIDAVRRKEGKGSSGTEKKSGSGLLLPIEGFEKYAALERLSEPLRRNIRRPLLFLASCDDPFHHPSHIGLPESLRGNSPNDTSKRHSGNPNIVYCMTKVGGHVGWARSPLDGQYSFICEMSVGFAAALEERDSTAYRVRGVDLRERFEDIRSRAFDLRVAEMERNQLKNVRSVGQAGGTKKVPHEKGGSVGIKEGKESEKPQITPLAWWRGLKSIIDAEFGTDSLEGFQWTGKLARPGVTLTDDFHQDGRVNRHFANQLIRIPRKTPVPTARKVLQLALNVGQGMADGSVPQQWGIADFIERKASG